MTIQHLVTAGVVCCPSCRSHLSAQSEVNFTCSQCHRSFPMVGGALQTVENSAEATPQGFMSRTFQSPAVYHGMIALKWFVMGMLRVRDSVLGIAQEIDDKSVLEVGCGPRVDLPSAEFDPANCAQYVGLDYSSQFVASARRALPGARFDFVQGDAGNLPFEDKSFDVVIAAFTVHHVQTSPQIVIDEMFRVAKEYVVVFDHVRSTRKFWSRFQTLYWRFADGGYHYLTRGEWTEILGSRHVIREIQTGAFGKHVIKWIAKV